MTNRKTRGSKRSTAEANWDDIFLAESKEDCLNALVFVYNERITSAAEFKSMKKSNLDFLARIFLGRGVKIEEIVRIKTKPGTSQVKRNVAHIIELIKPNQNKDHTLDGGEKDMLLTLHYMNMHGFTAGIELLNGVFFMYSDYEVKQINEGEFRIFHNSSVLELVGVTDQFLATALRVLQQLPHLSKEKICCMVTVLRSGPDSNGVRPWVGALSDLGVGNYAKILPKLMLSAHNGSATLATELMGAFNSNVGLLEKVELIENTCDTHRTASILTSYLEIPLPYFPKEKHKMYGSAKGDDEIAVKQIKDLTANDHVLLTGVMVTHANIKELSVASTKVYYSDSHIDSVYSRMVGQGAYKITGLKTDSGEAYKRLHKSLLKETCAQVNYAKSQTGEDGLDTDWS